MIIPEAWPLVAGSAPKAPTARPRTACFSPTAGPDRLTRRGSHHHGRGEDFGRFPKIVETVEEPVVRIVHAEPLSGNPVDDSHDPSLSEWRRQAQDGQ